MNLQSSNTTLCEAYQYDLLNRLAKMDRGTPDGRGTVDGQNIYSNTSGTFTFKQSWTLDQAGNWGEFLQDPLNNGNPNIDQLRTSNTVNEITAISGTGAFLVPAYDAAGNMKTAPKVGAETTTRLHYAYDAWNRQTKEITVTDYEIVCRACNFNTPQLYAESGGRGSR
jgi:hypothetical protein